MNADAELPEPSSGPHLATISHGGRFWDVYIEFLDELRPQDACRALLCFSPADRVEGEVPVRTTAIIVENSWEDALDRARSFEDHQLASLLRSCLPD